MNQLFRHVESVIDSDLMVYKDLHKKIHFYNPNPEDVTKAYLHIPKTAGMLRKTNFVNGGDCMIIDYRHCNDDFVEQAMGLLELGADWKGVGIHVKLEYIKPEVLEGKTIYTNVRNPWEKAHSQWRFASNHWDSVLRDSHNKVIQTIEQKYEITLKEHYLPEKWEDFSFQDWWEHRNKVTPIFNVTNPIMGYATQCEYIKGYDVVCHDTRAFSHMPKMNPSKVVRDYRNDYTPEMIQEVADWYKDDIDHWGYDFDTGATKNVVC